MAEQAQQAANAVKETVQDVTNKIGELTTETAGEKATAAPTTILDEVTGEQVSKTEYKKRQKLREKEAKKAEKAATTTAPPKKKAASAEEEEAHLNPNQYFEIRSRAVQKFRTSQEPNP